MNTSALSFIRFVAAIIVIIFHSTIGKDSIVHSGPKILIAGPEMVTFFYVLSGFVSVQAYYRKKKFSLTEYYSKRVARIYPVYLFALLLSIPLELYLGSFDTTAFILNLTFLQAWFSPYPLSINGPGWFLSGLMFYYVTLPVLLFFLRKSSPNPKLFLLIILMVWLATQVVLTILLNTSFYSGSPSFSHDLIFYFPISHYCSFLLGASGAYFLVSKRAVSRFSDFSSMLILLCCCCFVAVLLENQSFLNKLLGINLPYASSFYAPVFLSVIILICKLSNTTSSLLSVKPLFFLGRISFSIYILQRPVRFIARYLLDQTNISYDIFLLIYIPMLISIGILSLHLIERPIKVYVDKKF